MYNRKEALAWTGATFDRWPDDGFFLSPTGWRWREPAATPRHGAGVLLVNEENPLDFINISDWQKARDVYCQEMRKGAVLEDVARNLARWPVKSSQAAPVARFSDWRWLAPPAQSLIGWRLVSADNQEKITADEYLAKRAELINKPTRDTLPHWATSVAQISDGTWFAYAHPPTLLCGTWNAEASGRYMPVAKGDAKLAGHNWRNTLDIFALTDSGWFSSTPKSSGNFAQQLGRSDRDNKWQTAERLLALKGYVWSDTTRFWEHTEPQPHTTAIGSDPRESTAQLQRDLLEANNYAKHLEQRSDMLLTLTNLMSDELRKYTK